MKYAICNEMFGSLEFARAADLLAEHGYTGVEIAPYTLFGDFSAPAVRRGLAAAKSALASSGLLFAGLHWLFVKPDGLRLSSADPAERSRAWDHLRLLLDVSGELGGGVLVFGSPKQRSSRGNSRAEALELFAGGLSAAADYAEERRSTILLEALSSRDTDIVNTLDEAAALVRRIGKPPPHGDC